jgi:hypothetical protein
MNIRPIDRFAVYVKFWDIPTKGAFIDPPITPDEIDTLIENLYNTKRLSTMRTDLYRAISPIRNHIRHTIKSNQHE